MDWYSSCDKTRFNRSSKSLLLNPKGFSRLDLSIIKIMDLYARFNKKIKELYLEKGGRYILSSYLHFDISPLPKSVNLINDKTLDRAILKIYKSISDPKLFDKDRAYNFLPLLRVEENIYKFKHRKGSTQRRQDRKKPDKIRPLTYCSNYEKLIYIYYNLILEDLYEKKLHELGLEENVLAYRKIKKDDESGKNKCNLEFATDCFDVIKSETSKNGQCIAIALDIKGFFDNISHERIKHEWLALFENLVELPYNHYKIYESITKYSYIRKKYLLQKIFGIKNLKQYHKVIYGYTNKNELLSIIPIPLTKT